MSKLLAIACLCVLALVAVQAAPQEDSFERDLALEVPEFGEHVDGSFLTLDNMGLDLDVESSFAELASTAEQEESSEQPDNEAELETEEEPQSLVEVAAERKPATPWHRNNANQPVARHNAEIKCLDGDCTRATKVRKAKVGTHPNANTKPPPTKLDIALGAVKEEIMVRAKELHQQKEWTKKVALLIDEYQQKLQKVTGNIVSLRTQTKALLRKKKQIQNVQVQNKLRYKLKLAQSDLNRLQKQMEHIAGKENEFADTEKQLKGTMNALKNSLLKLRGQETKKLAQEGIELP
jgi:uncharacterized protein YoxC